MAAQPVIVLCASMLPIYFFLSQTHKSEREREREREREWMGEAMEESEKHICNTHTPWKMKQMRKVDVSAQQWGCGAVGEPWLVG